MNSCGLSEEEAISASKKVNFNTTTKPNSVIKLLKQYGFTQPHITKLINKRPTFLQSDPEKTLRPKFDFFKSRGFSGFDIAKLTSTDPSLLIASLEDKLIPFFDILKGIVHTDQNVITTLRRRAWFFGNYVLMENMLVNIEVLKEEGVPECNVSKFLISRPRVLTMETGKFREVVEELKSMGFDTSKTAFLVAIHAIFAMSKSTWEMKVGVYKTWGWSEDEILTAFRKCPYCMMASEKKINGVMSFLVNEMGYIAQAIVHCPELFTYNLEKRIAPRCLVIRILRSKGLLKQEYNINTIATKSDKVFLELFVSKFEKEAPELLNVYHETVVWTANHKDLHLHKPSSIHFTDDGKLVLRSFDYPTDTILSGQKLGPGVQLSSGRNILYVQETDGLVATDNRDKIRVISDALDEGSFILKYLYRNKNQPPRQQQGEEGVL
ncbi:uncharacterized protein LOC113358569 [Papaver somniferum]|uniref:uncharacterized protein LOC113358569 n=1 Tax=Papaver somniferum TaxID=3469 RepID=UPI000E6FB612|nr:uncharacterized protein LOC113358569 [Papaver somniferum]